MSYVVYLRLNELCDGLCSICTFERVIDGLCSYLRLNELCDGLCSIFTFERVV